MPMTGHRKTRTGCKRCKARKVKCDETKPICLACTRHNMPCEYTHNSPSPMPPELLRPRDHILELSLMHAWMASICDSLTPAKDFWKYEAPHLALRCQYLLDGILAMTALRASRETSRRWPASDAAEKEILRSRILPDEGSCMENAVPLARRDMITVSRKYFDQSLQGCQDAIAMLTPENIKYAFTCSTLISFYSFLILSENVEKDSLRNFAQWIGVASGICSIIKQWYAWLGEGWIDQAGLASGEPSLKTHDAVFRPEFRLGFEHLLQPVHGIPIAPEDLEAYEQTLSYIGLMHRNITQGLEPPPSICRRIFAMPARSPARFIELFRERDPRALVILAHFFAVIILAEEKVPWLQGVGQRQVPLLCEQIPFEYGYLVEWPLLMAGA